MFRSVLVRSHFQIMLGLLFTVCLFATSVTGEVVHAYSTPDCRGTKFIHSLVFPTHHCMHSITWECHGTQFIMNHFDNLACQGLPSQTLTWDNHTCIPLPNISVYVDCIPDGTPLTPLPPTPMPTEPATTPSNNDSDSPATAIGGGVAVVVAALCVIMCIRRTCCRRAPSPQVAYVDMNGHPLPLLQNVGIARSDDSVTSP